MIAGSWLKVGQQCCREIGQHCCFTRFGQVYTLRVSAASNTPNNRAMPRRLRSRKGAENKREWFNAPLGDRGSITPMKGAHERSALLTYSIRRMT